MGRHEVAIVRHKSHSLKIMISFTQYLFRFNDQIYLNELYPTRIDDVSINNEYEYENEFKPYSYSKSFSQISTLGMTPSSSL